MAHAATELFSEGHRIDSIHPASRNADVATFGWLSMRDYHKAVAIIDIGAIAANGTVNFKLTQATDDAGTGAKDITGKAITALGDTDDNTVLVVELDSSELDVSNNYDYINGELSLGGHAAILCQAHLIRYQPRFKDVDDSNLGEVVE